MGFFLGLFTALIPGFHVNTISLMLLSMCLPLQKLSIITLNINPVYAPLMISCLIVSLYVAHTFVNIIPATFLGVPEEDVALTMMPAHSLLLKGRGYEVIVLSATGSFLSAVITLIIAFPMKFLLSEPVNLYQAMRDIIAWIIIMIIGIMILTEKDVRTMIFSFIVMILSGIYGMIILQMPIESPFGLPSTPLFSALSGLFGFSTLISSLVSKTEMVEQILKEPVLTRSERISAFLSVLTGSLSGIFVSIIPGVTTAAGTIIALTLRGDTDERQSIITLSSVNTAVSIATIFNLFIIGRARSGVAVTVENLLGMEKWNTILPPYNLVNLAIAMVISSSLSLPFTCLIGKILSQKITKISYQKLSWLGVFLLMILSLIFSGTIGLLILLTGASIGLISIFTGARRSSCMGVLLIPLLIRFLGIS